jgi:hypothetical protein
MKKITLMLRCGFTKEEIEARANEMCMAMMRYEEVEELKKEVARDFTEELKMLRATLRRLSKEIRERGSDRPVECEVLFHKPVAGMKQIIRLDTGELVREEQMSFQERQENLFDDVSELERLARLQDYRREDGQKTETPDA